MEKHRFTIESNRTVAALTHRLVLKADDPDLVVGGEFVNLSLDGFFLRRPLSLCDREPGRITLLYKTVGKGTEALSALREGEVLDVLTGLGKGFDAAACRERALLVAGGLGAAPLYLLCKELKERGRHVTAVLGFNKAEEIVLEEDFRALCDEVVLATLDGSAGVKGFVTDALATLEPDWDYFYTCGPLVMMKAVCRALEGPGEASLEERMGCGSGFCYCCTCETVSGPKRVCMDGPVFKKEELTW